MKNIKVLDCTLRDGVRIIDCAFDDKSIYKITDKLTKAKIDIIEVGFLRDWRNTNYSGNSTFFTDIEQIVPFIPQYGAGTTYVAFVDFGMFDFDSLKPVNDRSITGIRVGFTKKDLDNHRDLLVENMKSVKEKGYQLFVQGVNSLGYTDRELLDIVEMTNEINPTSFGIVDTYGAMYIDDVIRLYNLIDHNLNDDIAIDFHSHNNFQLSFSFAQEVIKLSRGVRSVIIDATLNGMGKNAGNLNTELITDFLVRKMAYDYELDIVFDAIDEHIYDLREKHQWGYSTASLMAGIYKSHPNNVIYLTEKFRLDTKDVKNILSMLNEQERQSYDYDKIDRLLQNYNDSKHDDHDVIEKLRTLILDRPVLVLAPGASLTEYQSDIQAYISKKHPLIISVNFVADYQGSYSFFANKKRYHSLDREASTGIIVTSDIAKSTSSEMIVNYHSLVNHGHKYFNNSVMMLLNLLKRLSVREIALAGMDGFTKDNENNYFDRSFEIERISSQVDGINADIAAMLKGYVEKTSASCELSLITPSIFSPLV